MYKNLWQWWLFAGVALALCGCVEGSPEHVTIKGKVMKVGQSNLVMNDGTHFMFLPVAVHHKEQLKTLKKGDEVSLLGKTAADNPGAVDIDAIVLPDGRHVQLGD